MIPKDADAWYREGDDLSKLEKYEEALKAYEKAIEFNAEYADAWVGKGTVLFRLERYEEALKAYEKAIEFNAEYVFAWAGKGAVLSELKRYEEALKAYEKAIELNPEYVYAWVGKGAVLSRLERYEDALKAHEKAIELNPEYVYAWAGKGTVLSGLKTYEEALKAYEKAIALNLKYAGAWAGKGNVLFRLERYEEALRALEKAIELDPKYAYAWTGKGVVLVKLEKYKKAMKALKKAIELDQKNVDAHINLGELFFNLGNIKGSSKKVQVSLDIDENNVFALSLQGRINIENKDYYSAAKSFEKAISLNIPNPSLFLWDAYANYLKIEFSPSSKIDKVYQEKENIALIIRKLERANKISNIHGKEEVRAYILYFLGYFYYKINDISTAKEKLEECIKLKSTIKKPARKLLEIIWNFQIRPNWIEWWLTSPIHCWKKRIIFFIISVFIFRLFQYPIMNPEFNTNWTLYYFCIILLLIILISPRIESFKAKEFEIEMHSPPPFEFILSPSTMEMNIGNLLQQ